MALCIRVLSWAFAALLLVHAAPARAQLVISELYATTNRTDDTAFIELVNTGPETVFLPNWGFIARGPNPGEMGLRIFSYTGYLRPGETYVVSLSPDSHYEEWGELPDSGFDRSFMTEEMRASPHPIFGLHTGWWLDRAGGAIQLFDPSGVIRDSIQWGALPNSTENTLPSPLRGESFHRRDPFVGGPGLPQWEVGPPTPGEPLYWGCGAPICGNGELEPGEACDDGNALGGDGCSAGCEIEPGAHCAHEFQYCGRSEGPASHCVVLNDHCAKKVLLSALRVDDNLDGFTDGADWYEVLNASPTELPLTAVELMDLFPLPAGHGRGSFEPGRSLAPQERLLVINRRIPVETHLHSGYADYGSYGPDTGFDYHFGTPPSPYAVQYPRVAGDRSARWPDQPLREPILLAARQDQLMLHCAGDTQRIIDTFSYQRADQSDYLTVPGWIGPRKLWYPELIEEGVIQSVVFRRYPETQDTDTAADWHLSRCPDPGRSSEHREAPVGGANVVRELPADGRTYSVILSDEARQRPDAQVWVAPGLDARVQLHADNASISVIAPTVPDIIEFEWFAMTECWISDRYQVTLRFGDPIRCYPDNDADGFGDAHSSGVIVASECPAGSVENANDCDDQNPLVHAGAAELCDGLDNDCNSFTLDGEGEPWFGKPCDGNDSDLCEDGHLACVLGRPYCVETNTGILDYCDGIDNDCNPATPDGHDDPRVDRPCDGRDADLCVQGLTICESGTIACDEPHDPTTRELCDGIDNDCNPSTPDGYDELTFGQRCEAGTGACLRQGVHACQNAALRCTAVPGAPAQDDTTCDGIDNDCNGLVDDGVPQIPISCGTGACQRDGVEYCENGAILAQCTPGTPIQETFESGLCNDGIDNDCDGLTDDQDPDCLPIRRCYYDADRDGWPGTALDIRAVDCDGMWEGHYLSDENFDCNDDPEDPCAPLTWNGATELCDGCDNDCNGQVDETYPRLGTSCRESSDLCEAHTWACAADGRSLTCNTHPSSENIRPESPKHGTCDDGLDNDCDGLIDFDDPDCGIQLTGGRGFGCSSSPHLPLWPLAILGLALFLLRTRHREL